MRWMPEKPRWRIWSFRVHGNIVVPINRTIGNYEQLQKLISKYDPIDIYYSAGYFFKPHKMGKDEQQYSERLFFYSDICIDLDDVPFEEVEKTLKAMKTYSLKYILQTSKDSYQIVYYPEKLYGNTSKRRLRSFKSSRKKVVEILKDNNVKADFPITLDHKRVIRLPLSLHRSGFKTRFIHNPSLEGRRRRRKPMIRVRPPTNIRGNKDMSPTPPSVFTSYHISTRYKKQEVLCLEYNSPYLQEWRMLQEKYKTGTLYVLYYPKNKKWKIISLKAMHPRRIEKIASASTSSGQQYSFRVSSIFNKKGDKYAYAPIPVLSLECPSFPMESFSPHHRKALNGLGFTIAGEEKDCRIMEQEIIR